MFLNQINAPVTGDELDRWKERRFREFHSIAIMAAMQAAEDMKANGINSDVIVYKEFDKTDKSLWQIIKRLFK